MFSRTQTKMKRNRSWVRRKNFRKISRSILQMLILILIGYQIVTTLITFKHYVPSDSETLTNSSSFIAISYFGVARSTTADHMSNKELDAQLRALYDHGYVTVSQQDIIDFYTDNKPLPQKALFLAFEDGRNDSALFSNPSLEKYNFKATMLTYANKMGNNQGKFLQPRELLSMEKNGFWELGSNGYRLSYINIVDKDKQYFNHLTQEEFLNKTSAIYYNHYLMDFIRDEYGVPIENSEQMKARIDEDYKLMHTIYSDKLGYMPSTYMIMHADSLYNGMNHLVEEVNDKNIKDIFKLHFNREGKMVNTVEANRYNLTRVQPAPYWRTNHLLMKLHLDTGEKVNFVTGLADESSNWTVENGVTEFAPEEIVLTTEPGKKATMTINNLVIDTPFSLSVTLGGHNSGHQLIHLGESIDQSLSLQLRLHDEYIYVEQVNNKGIVERLVAVRGKDSPIADIPIEIIVQNNQLTLVVNKRIVMDSEPISEQITNWNVSFSAESLKDTNRWEDENDYIYDGIFKHIELIELDSSKKEIKVLYTNKLNGINKWLFSIQTLYHDVIDWAIETF